MCNREKHEEKAGRLRMDRNPQPSRMNDPSLKIGRRKEIDNVMKKARRDPNLYWDKKLLEVEERDPNRWHHTGYKKLYVSAGHRSRSKSISPVRHRSSKADPRYSPVLQRRPRSPSARRSPVRKPHSPPPMPKGRSSSDYDSDYRSPVPQRSRVVRTPPSLEREHRKTNSEKHGTYEKERAAKLAKHYTPPASSSNQYRRGSPKPRVTSTSDDIVLIKHKHGESTSSPKRKKIKKTKQQSAPVRIKVEPRSPSTDSTSSDEGVSVFSALSSNTKMTLSERFGKIAQWSVDRSNMENMRITKNSGGDLRVSIEDGIQSPEDPRPSYSPVRPVGHFPEELMTEGPRDLSWDDVRVRYQYYKDRGYLRGLGLQDYVKWEEWWYQYQDWLRRCEIWERTQLTRRRRKKVPLTSRLN